MYAFQIRTPSDTPLYLWRAHNMVNRRLAGDTTDDPAFPKRQFPMNFLCKNCQARSPKERSFNEQSSQVNSVWNEQQTLQWLLDYYTNVRPSPRPLYVLGGFVRRSVDDA